MLGGTGNRVEGDGVSIRDKRMEIVNVQCSQVNLWVQCKHSTLKAFQETRHLKER